MNSTNSTSGRNVKRLLTTALTAGALATTIGIAGLATAAPAEAASVSCGSGRCTVWLNKTETRALGSGKVPRPPAMAPQLTASYYALAYVHKWIAGQYANRGWCSGIRVDIRPWATQGYFGYPC